ncbi:MAG: hypothetical protein U0905_00710 [Pirellulales bacterium]
MLKLLLIIPIAMILGYIVLASLGGLLVQIISTNVHDKAQEVAMTSLFFFGPIGALLGLLGAVVYWFFF